MTPTLKDKTGKAYPFHALSLAELVAVETQIGGSLANNLDKMTFATAIFIMASGIDAKESDVTASFDASTLTAGVIQILHLNFPKKNPRIRIGSRDDDEDDD